MNFDGTKKLLWVVSHDLWAQISMGIEILGAQAVARA